MKSKKKEKKLEEDLQEKIKELEEKLRRALADYHNLLNRVELRQKEWQEEASARIIDKLLDVYDDLRRAESHLGDKGLTMAVNQFWAVLQSEGVAEIRSDGEEFDPELMDCVQVVRGPKNKVVETLIKGYTFKGKVIRPARVKVGRGENN